MVMVVIKAHSKVNRMFLYLTLSLRNLYINILQSPNNLFPRVNGGESEEFAE